MFRGHVKVSSGINKARHVAVRRRERLLKLHVDTIGLLVCKRFDVVTRGEKIKKQKVLNRYDDPIPTGLKEQFTAVRFR